MGIGGGGGGGADRQSIIDYHCVRSVKKNSKTFYLKTVISIAMFKVRHVVEPVTLLYYALNFF